MSAALYCRPTDNLMMTALSSLTVTTEDSVHPKTNLYDGLPNLPYKATATSVTIVVTLTGALTIQGISLINHNLAGAIIALTNNNGLNTTVTVPANTLGGRCVNPWKDLRASGGSATASVWTLTITGAAANIAIGELIFASTLRVLDAKWGLAFKVTQPMLERRTFRKVPIRFGLDVRYRMYTATAGLSSSTRDELMILNEATYGPLKTFLFILDPSKNDSALVTYADPEWSNTFDAPDYEPVAVVLEEWCSGLPL